MSERPDSNQKNKTERQRLCTAVFLLIWGFNLLKYLVYYYIMPLLDI